MSNDTMTPQWRTSAPCSPNVSTVSCRCGHRGHRPLLEDSVRSTSQDVYSSRCCGSPEYTHRLQCGMPLLRQTAKKVDCSGATWYFPVSWGGGVLHTFSQRVAHFARV